MMVNEMAKLENPPISRYSTCGVAEAVQDRLVAVGGHSRSWPVTHFVGAHRQPPGTECVDDSCRAG